MQTRRILLSHRAHQGARLAVLGALLVQSLLTAADAASPHERLRMDFGWKFHLGDDWGTGEDLVKAGASRGPAGPNFADAGWRTVDLPHDWAIELPFDPASDGSHGFKPVGPGFQQNSVGWYRRAFMLPKEDLGRRLSIDFDGAFRDCRVFLNGYLVAHHEGGYSSFRCDITDVARCGAGNVLAVRVDASEFEGWFYEGAGIYRHVWLVKTGPVAIVPHTTFVYSSFKNNVPEGPATIQLRTRLANTEKAPSLAEVTWQIVGPDGRTLDAGGAHETGELAPASEGEFSHEIGVPAPELWSPESPKLYQLITTVHSGGGVADRSETEFGIRTVAFDADKGFLLNGKPYPLKGTCNHQDHAGVGAALPERLQYFRVARLKEMGSNAIRTSHNPPTPELLEACDQLGMLVMDENRLLGTDAANLDRLAGLVRRDRNHPSVVVWSIGNEEGVQTSETGGRIAETMQRRVRQLDPTRPVTYAANVGNVFAGVNRVIDVRGWNYHIGRDMDQYHAAHPAQPNVGTEQASTVCTRGIYANDPARGYVSAYDDNAPGWANTTETWWKFFATRPWLSGGFAWTGFDYRGEPTPYSWPCINSHFGILDTCGFPKDNFYYYQAWWSDRDVLHLLPHWNWPGREGQEIDVRCFSNCDEVELFLNGRSLGRQTMPRDSHLAWKVNYAAGTLAARGLRGGRVIAEAKVETTGPPARIQLTPDRATINADGQDVSVVTVAITDTHTRVVPVADNLVHFDLSGAGRILGVGNGDPSCHEPDTYVRQPPVRTRALDDWRLMDVPTPNERPETAEIFDDSAWRKVNVRRSGGPLAPGRSAVYRSRFTVNDADLAADRVTVTFGMIDDEGWVFVNGQPAGQSHDWRASPSFDIRRLLHPGANTIAVAVRNHEAQGGVNKGVTLEVHVKPLPADWKRSAFNGLAQVIVQSTHQAGEIRLTARSPGLAETTAALQSLQQAPRPTLP